MSISAVLYQKSVHVARITLNRPSTLNVISMEMGQEIEAACRQAGGDDDVYAIIITGTGSAFCAGSELEQSFRAGKTRLRAETPAFHSLGETADRHFGVQARPALEEMGTQFNLAAAVAAIDKPVIAALNGDAFGQGLELALACDLRIAASTARFGFPHVGVGIIPLDGGTQRLPRLIGKGKALEMVLLAQTIDAAEAESIGLVSKVVAADALAAETEALAKAMAAKAPIALRYIKEAVNKGLDLTLEQGLRLEADLYFLLHTTSDRTEGIKAFLGKRTPDFKGK